MIKMKAGGPIQAGDLVTYVNGILVYAYSPILVIRIMYSEENDSEEVKEDPNYTSIW